MKFIAIDPKREEMMLVDVPDLTSAMAMVGLMPGYVDHGIVFRDRETKEGVGYVVYEYGHFQMPDSIDYCCLADGRLLAGATVLYAFDCEGKTIDISDDLPAITAIKYMHSLEDIERAIAAGHVSRPEIAITQDRVRSVIWRWPDPAPADIQERMAKGHK